MCLHSYITIRFFSCIIVEIIHVMYVYTYIVTCSPYRINFKHRKLCKHVYEDSLKGKKETNVKQEYYVYITCIFIFKICEFR